MTGWYRFVAWWLLYGVGKYGSLRGHTMLDIKKVMVKAGNYCRDNLGGLAAVGSICSILSFIIGLLSKQTWVLGIGYTVFALSLCTIVFHEMRWRRKAEQQREHTRRELEKTSAVLSVYQRKSEDFHRSFHALREANTLLMVSDAFDADRNMLFISYLSDSLTELAEFFSDLNRSKCSLCIKILFEKEGDAQQTYASIEFATLVRDRKSQWRSPLDEPKYSLHENTAFNCIWNTHRRWFYSSDLSKESHYDNKNPMWHEDKHYLTALVLPIQAPKLSVDKKLFHGIKGYLCLDSDVPNAFHEEPTVFWLACLADLLYVTLMRYKSVVKGSGYEAE